MNICIIMITDSEEFKQTVAPGWKQRPKVLAKLVSQREEVLAPAQLQMTRGRVPNE